MNPLQKMVSLFSLVGLASVLPLQAAIVYWDNDVADNEFTAGNNWDTGTFPGTDDTASIQNNDVTANYAILNSTTPNTINTLRVGCTADGTVTGPGRLDIESGAALDTVALHIGLAPSTPTAGYVFQSGGTLNVTAASGMRNSIGKGDGTSLNNYGYYKLTGGVIDVPFQLWVGWGGVGVIDQTGGEFRHGDRMYIGSAHPDSQVTAENGYAVWNISGGTAHHYLGGGNSLPRIGHKDYSFGIINVSGTGHFLIEDYPIVGYSDATGIINLGAIGAGGGTFTADRLNIDSELNAINFHGGTLQAGANHGDFLDNTADAAENWTNTHIYSEGAVIDTQGYNITIADNLDAPTGKGVANVNITNPGSGYISPPAVKITGTTGLYATGYATISGINGTVTGVVLTNPGIDFADDEVVTVELLGGGGTGATATINTAGGTDLATNTSGGLTKQGSGMLRLTASSTYTGATTVEAGSFILGTETGAAIPGSVGSSSGITVHSGALLGGTTNSSSSPEPPVTLQSGAIIDLGDPENADAAIGEFQTSGLTLGNKSHLIFSIDDQVTFTSDLIKVPGIVDSTGGDITVHVDFQQALLTGPGTFTLIDASGGSMDPGDDLQWIPDVDAVKIEGIPPSLGTINLQEHSGAGGRLDVNFAAPVRWWTGTAGMTWNTALPGSWVGGVPTTGADRAIFTSAGIKGNVDLTQNVTLSSINFSDSGYIIDSSNGSAITLDSSLAINAQILHVASAANDIDCDLVTAPAGDPIINVTQETGVLNINGVVGGTGIITKRGPGKLYLSNANNTYNGPTVVEEGTLKVDSLVSGTAGGGTSPLGNNGPGPANLVLDGGTLLYDGTAATADRGLTVGGTSAGADISTISTNANLTLTGQFASTVGGNRLAKEGTGTLTLTYAGAMTISPHYLHVNDGTLAFDGGASAVYTTTEGTRISANTAATAGTIDMDSGTLNTTRAYVAYADDSTGSLNVSGGNFICTVGSIAVGYGTNSMGTVTQTGGQLSTAHRVYLGYKANALGTYSLSDGTLNVYDNFFIGYADGSIGVVNQSGGTVNVLYYDPVPDLQSGWIRCGYAAGSGYGYYHFTGGEINAPGMMAGGSGHEHVGIFEQSGGTMNISASIRVANAANSTGLYNLTGGTVNVANYMNCGGGGSIGTWGQTNVNGMGTALNLGTYLRIAAYGTTGEEGKQSSKGYFNLGTGATVTTSNVETLTLAVDGGEAFFNFHGGTLRPNASTGDPGDPATHFLRLPTDTGGTLIYSEGGIIDTDGYDVVISEPLQAPTGYGVAGIALTDGGSGYDGPPIVQISGGAGRGATAIATVSGGAVTGITITNPGTGYLDSDTLTVTLLRGGCDTVATADAVLTANTQDGGLEKKGLGKLTLAAVSTYTGDTTVHAGTLCIAGSITSDTTVKDGATLGGEGNVIGDVLGEEGSTISGGCSIGELTVTDGNVDIDGTWLVEYDGDTETIDVLTVTGAAPTTGDLDITSATIDFSNLGVDSLDEPVYVFANYVTLTGEGTATEQNVPPGYSVDYYWNSGTSIALVPEPSTLVLLVMGLIGLAAYARRRR